MIQKPDIGNDYLEDCLNGKIQKGDGIGCEKTDKHIRFKPSQVVTINGFDNVGKTYWLFWYLLCLSKHFGYTWVLWTGENQPGGVKRALIEMFVGKKIRQMSDSEFYKARDLVNMWFTFIDNSKLYKPYDLLSHFNDCNYDFKGCVIDPFTGLDRSMSYEGNYEFLNRLVEFTRSTSKSVYLTTHPNTEAARKRFPKDHDMWGYFMPPGKADTEGGQSFANRSDDFWTIHRHVQHPSLKYFLEVHVRKVKEKETGGEPTDSGDPLLYEWNNGLGYVINGFNPLKNAVVHSRAVQTSVLLPSTEFDDDLPF